MHIENELVEYAIPGEQEFATTDEQEFMEVIKEYKEEVLM
jgi:hypothetical protein